MLCTNASPLISCSNNRIPVRCPYLPYARHVPLYSQCPLIWAGPTSSVNSRVGRGAAGDPVRCRRSHSDLQKHQSGHRARSLGQWRDSSSGLIESVMARRAPLSPPSALQWVTRYWGDADGCGDSRLKGNRFRFAIFRPWQVPLAHNRMTSLISGSL